MLDSAGGTEVKNTAEITIGDNDPNQTNEVTTNVPGKDSVVEGDGELQVGKVLTYTISYKNPEDGSGNSYRLKTAFQRVLIM